MSVEVCGYTLDSFSLTKASLAFHKDSHRRGVAIGRSRCFNMYLVDLHKGSPSTLNSKEYWREKEREYYVDGIGIDKDSVIMTSTELVFEY